MRLIFIFILSFGLCAVIFCGSAASQTTVAIHPVNAAITIHQSQQYTASGTVTWFVDGIAGGNSTVGMISSSGLYHPPTTVGAHTIKAVLTSNTAVSASAKIYVENHPGVFTYHFNSKRSGTNDKEIALSIDTQ